jgi:hypothetical protein
MRTDLAGLGPVGFERLCQALAVYVLGPGIEVFGAGPDGGREASFSGLVQYPASADPWNGYGVLQAKYKDRLFGTGADTTWLRRQVKAELDAWADPGRGRTRAGRRPEYLIFTTNVPLSGIAGTGGKDRVGKLIEDYAADLGLKGWRVWDGVQIGTYLDAYPEVRRAFAALITPSEVLAAMRDRQDTPPEVWVVLDVPEVRIRPGQPGVERAFGEAYAAAGGPARLGPAVGKVAEQGPGWVQHFDGGQGGEPAVICAVYGRTAVAVSGPAWNALCAVGDISRGGGPAGAGLPVGAVPSTALLGADSEQTELAGGTWGPGALVRQAPDGWAWRPRIAFDDRAYRDRDAWTFRGLEMDLRVRVAARIPVADDDLRITGGDRARLEAALQRAPLNAVMTALAARYGLHAGSVAWEEMPGPAGHNNTRFASYQASVPGPDGRQAILVSAWFMHGGHGDGLSCVADLRADFAAIRPAPPESPALIPPGLRVTQDELARFFTAAWQLTAMSLPLAVTTSPAGLTPAGAPRVELHIVNERPELRGMPRPLRTLDMVDLSGYGHPRSDGRLDSLSAGVTAPIDLPWGKIAGLVDEAMTRMTDDAGFTGAPAASGHA